MKLITVMLFIMLLGCQTDNKRTIKDGHKYVTHKQWFLFHLYSEAKCRYWHDTSIKSMFCLTNAPTYNEAENDYFFEFEFNVDPGDDLVYFRNSDEKQRLQILREDVDYVVDSWRSFVQLGELPMVPKDRISQIKKQILENMIIRIKFNYLGNTEYNYYMGEWLGKSKETNITKKAKEVIAI